MEEPVQKEMENLVEYLRTYGAKTTHNLLGALLVWLFGNLVFIPLANSLNWQTRIFVSLIFFIVFTILVARALPGLKRLIDAFSIFPARKYGIRKELSYENSLVLFRHVLYNCHCDPLLVVIPIFHEFSPLYQWNHLNTNVDLDFLPVT